MKSMILTRLRLVLLISMAFLFAGCGNDPVPGSRYKLAQDKAPDQPFDPSLIKELTPVYEAPSAAGNKSPYTVWGKSYTILPDSKGYRAEGTASWYGKKFHGYKTSNGEVYDMYQLSAAHKSLPLPSYVLVTNLENNRQVLVRVNDRGPFHGDRVIDLSYAAAIRLDMLDKGTARVRLEAIDPVTWNGGMDRKLNQLTPPVLVQVAAMSKAESAEKIRFNLSKKTGQTIRVVSSERNQKPLHKVQIGPVQTRSELRALMDVLIKAGFSRPIIIQVGR